jgi:carbon starvation protein CstA
MIPIDKVIGRFYPLLGAFLLVMTVSILIALFLSDYTVLPNIDVFKNFNPKGADKAPVWPLLFITISCGALSGFHSTQSPIMARCLRTEKDAQVTFFGAMIAEGIIGLIWCTVALSVYSTPDALHSAGSWSNIVHNTTISLLGNWGSILATVAVIILPITTGDTAFREGRLIIAETFGLSQKELSKRLLIAVPLFIVGFILVFVGKKHWNVIWQYFGWSNQVLATFVLWATAIFLRNNKQLHWIATVPATFMSAVTVTFILYAKIGFNIPYQYALYAGIISSIILVTLFLVKVKNITNDV